MPYAGKLEFAQARKMRERNTPLYRLAHWPIWIWVFFLAPGPLTFSLFAHGFGRGNLLWLSAVLIATGIAALRGQLPGAEPRPYILRFDEDKPNPLYRRVCYTFAWSAVLTFALLNLAGLIIAVAHRPLVHAADLPLRLRPPLPLHPSPRRGSASSPASAAPPAAKAPNAATSTAPSGPSPSPKFSCSFSGSDPRRHAHTRAGSAIKLVIYVAALAAMAAAARRGLLPRTRPIVPGEMMVAD